jgi:hypothetical protein
MIRRRKKSSGDTIQRQLFLDVLKKVHLGGAINECVLVLEDGNCTIEVVDITNNIVVVAKCSKMASKGVSNTIGLGNIEVIIKFLSSIAVEGLTFATSKDGDRMTLGASKGSRKLQYLTSVSELISTRLRIEEDDEHDYAENFRSMPTVVVDLTPEDVKSIVSYIGLVKSKLVTITVTKKAAVSFITGSSTEHNFTVEVDKDLVRTSTEFDDAFEVKVNGENLAKVLSALEFGDEESSTIAFADECPLVVEDDETLWALTPIEDNEGE